jgi:uncharacterized protein DUF6283
MGYKRVTMSCLFKGNTPCKDCPYRTDAPLQKWSIEEFKDLLAHEHELMGTVYGCHKNNGTVCKGWLMDQDKRGFPSISLRIALSRHQVSRVYLDSLKCASPLFDSVSEMAEANYPELEE